jgi:hypothetical protein
MLATTPLMSDMKFIGVEENKINEHTDILFKKLGYI